MSHPECETPKHDAASRSAGLQQFLVIMIEKARFFPAEALSLSLPCTPRSAPLCGGRTGSEEQELGCSLTRSLPNADASASADAVLGVHYSAVQQRLQFI